MQVLSVLNKIQDWIFLRDMKPATLKNYWGNVAVCKAGNKSLDEYIEWDLLKDTSPQMLKWSQEMYDKVQVKGKRVTKRRTVYPNGKATILDFIVTPFRVRVPTDLPGETSVKTLSLVHTKSVNLNNEAMQEANSAAMLMNFAEDAIFLLPGTSDAEGNNQGEAPALFTNLRARQAYSLLQDSKVDSTTGEGGERRCEQAITLARVLDTFSFQDDAEREVLKEKILSLKLHDSSVIIEQEMPAARQSVLPNIPRNRKISFTPVTDPVSAKAFILVSENDISDLQSALRKLQLSVKQRSQLLYSMLPEYVADSLCAGERLSASVHPEACIFFQI